MVVIRTDCLNPKYIKVKGQNKLEIIMIKIDIKLAIDQTVAIRECHIEVELSMDEILENGHIKIKNDKK